MKNILRDIKKCFGHISVLVDMLAPSNHPKFWSYLCMFMAGEFFVAFELRRSLPSLVFFVMMLGLAFYWMRRISPEPPAKKEEPPKI